MSRWLNSPALFNDVNSFINWHQEDISFTKDKDCKKGETAPIHMPKLLGS